jgi:MFS transporter, SP family, sugar:H+ symporter
MIIGIMFLPESPRWDYRHNNLDRAQRTIAVTNGLKQDHPSVMQELQEIQDKWEAEQQRGQTPWYEIFTGPRMFYRLVLGMALGALQQLTGAASILSLFFSRYLPPVMLTILQNFFFYYGISIFSSMGFTNPFIIGIILGAVNFTATLPGLYIVERLGRRVSLIAGAIWMFACFLVRAYICLVLIIHSENLTNTCIYISRSSPTSAISPLTRTAP